MIGIVAVADYKCLYRCEMAFDTVHPGCIRGDEYEDDIMPGTPVSDLFLVMRTEVVEDDIDSLVGGVSASDYFEERKNFSPTFALRFVHPDPVCVNVIGRQVMPDTMVSVVVCTTSSRFLRRCPRGTGLRSYFDRPKFIKANDR